MIEDAMNLVAKAESEADDKLKAAKLEAETIKKENVNAINKMKSDSQADDVAYRTDVLNKAKEDGDKVLERTRAAADEKAKAMVAKAAANEKNAVDAVIAELF